MLNFFFRRKFVGLKLSILLFLFLSFSQNTTFASSTSGTIDSVYKYAWGENIGWINFGCDRCNVSVEDTQLTGYAWSTEFGWINLNPDNSGVKNDEEGNLSGYAWSANLGWINFDGVTIDSTGEFSGFATLESDSGRINFNCALGDSCDSSDFKVKTDWIPQSARSRGGSGSVSSSPNPPSQPLNPIFVIVDNIIDFFNPPEASVDIIEQVPQIAPPAFKTTWNLLPVKAIRQFVFAPLPYEVRMLAEKFPELGQTLKKVGVERMTDMGKLTGVSLNLPGLAELTSTLKNVGAERLGNIDKLNGVVLDVPGLSNLDGQMIGSVGAGNIALIKGLPLAKFPLVAKQNLPAEFVFARANGELVDLNVIMSVGEKGEVTQQITSLPGQALKLVVKPISRAKSVTGYFIFKASAPRVTKASISRSSLMASALFSMNGLVEEKEEIVPVENKLVLSSFEYIDPDHDGIYTAEVMTPSVPGEYEVVTVIEYIDPTLGTRQMRMITVIDPEGYVYEKNNNKETRIPSAIVSLYQLNLFTKKYELWDAKSYQQENPQVTDVRGTYSFLVPEGSYYFSVEAPGYLPYQGKVFVVTEGSGIHQNIELKSEVAWYSRLNWETTLLIVVLLLLIYNLYRNKRRD